MKICTKCNENKELIDFYFKHNKHTHWCKICFLKNRKLNYIKNKQKIIEQVKNYDIAHKKQARDRIKKYFKKYIKTEKGRKCVSQCIIKRQKERLKTDPLFKTKTNLRSRLRRALRSKKFNKHNSFKNYIGCSLDELKKYLEAKFTDGMSWENQGKWHIDHIIPLSLAKTGEEMCTLCHYTNLQPLWAIDNIKKGNKVL